MTETTDKNGDKGQEYKNLALDPDTHKRLKVIAAQKGVAMKDLIADCVDRLEKEKKNNE